MPKSPISFKDYLLSELPAMLSVRLSELTLRPDGQPLTPRPSDAEVAAKLANIARNALENIGNSRVTGRHEVLTHTIPASFVCTEFYSFATNNGGHRLIGIFCPAADGRTTQVVYSVGRSFPNRVDPPSMLEINIETLILDGVAQNLGGLEPEDEEEDRPSLPSRMHRPGQSAPAASVVVVVDYEKEADDVVDAIRRKGAAIAASADEPEKSEAPPVPPVFNAGEFHAEIRKVVAGHLAWVADVAMGKVADLLQPNSEVLHRRIQAGIDRRIDRAVTSAVRKSMPSAVVEDIAKHTRTKLVELQKAAQAQAEQELARAKRQADAEEEEEEEGLPILKDVEEEEDDDTDAARDRRLTVAIVNNMLNLVACDFTEDNLYSFVIPRHLTLLFGSRKAPRLPRPVLVQRRKHQIPEATAAIVKYIRLKHEEVVLDLSSLDVFLTFPEDDKVGIVLVACIRNGPACSKAIVITRPRPDQVSDARANPRSRFYHLPNAVVEEDDDRDEG